MCYKIKQINNICRRKKFNVMCTVCIFFPVYNKIEKLSENSSYSHAVAILLHVEYVYEVLFNCQYCLYLILMIYFRKCWNRRKHRFWLLNWWWIPPSQSREAFGTKGDLHRSCCWAGICGTAPGPSSWRFPRPWWLGQLCTCPAKLVSSQLNHSPYSEKLVSSQFFTLFTVFNKVVSCQ